MLSFGDYSEKAFVVTGDTKEFKEEIKDLGGKWNKTAGGWIFPKSKKSDVRKKLGEIATVNEKDEDAEQAEEEGPPKKKAKTESGDKDKDSEGQFLELDAKKRVSLSQFKGKTYIDIREYYKDASSGEKKPSPKGIMLTKELFEKLCDLSEQVLEAIGDQDEKFSADLGGTKKVALSKFQGKFYVGIREFWQDDAGEWRPGKKGVSLSIDAYRKFVDSSDEVAGWLA